MTLPAATFYYMAVASVASALMAVTRKSPVHSILWVLALFLHVAGIFLLLKAEFLAAVQVIVYAGAILIFYLFVQMLLDLPDKDTTARFSKHWPLAALAGLVFASLAWLARVATPDPIGAGVIPGTQRIAEGKPPGSPAEVGQSLFGPYALPFEIASLVLLAAIIGAVILARRRAAS